MTSQKLISQGAEALIELHSKDNILKKRIKKSYRISELDSKIRTRRTKSEAKLLIKASKIISAPKVIEVFPEKSQILMQYLEGQKLSENLDSFLLKEQKQICNLIGKSIAKLHNKDIIHGDLTTSNMILKNKKVFIMDFGLGFISKKFEDKSVDLHLLKQALEAKHFQNANILFDEIIKAYKKTNKDSKIILERLIAVGKRGRYKF